MRPENSNVTCLGCGQPVLGPTVINRMPDGESCRHCVERVLDAQPSLLREETESDSSSQAVAPILYFPNPNSSWDAPEPA